MQNLNIVCAECNTLNILPSNTSTPTCSHCQAELDDPFVIEVDDTKCTQHIQEDDLPLILDFYSPLCGPCMAMYEDYEDAALAYGLKVRFLKINADEHQAVAQKYQVGALPTLIAFHKGLEVSRISAALTRVELSLWADQLDLL